MCVFVFHHYMASGDQTQVLPAPEVGFETPMYELLTSCENTYWLSTGCCVSWPNQTGSWVCRLSLAGALVWESCGRSSLGAYPRVSKHWEDESEGVPASHMAFS